MWPSLGPAGVCPGPSEGTRPLRGVGRKGKKRKHRSFRENEPSLSEKILQLLGNPLPPHAPTVSRETRVPWLRRAGRKGADPRRAAVVMGGSARCQAVENEWLGREGV